MVSVQMLTILYVTTKEITLMLVLMVKIRSVNVVAGMVHQIITYLAQPMKTLSQTLLLKSLVVIRS